VFAGEVEPFKSTLRDQFFDSILLYLFFKLNRVIDTASLKVRRLSDVCISLPLILWIVYSSWCNLRIDLKTSFIANLLLFSIRSNLALILVSSENLSF
jgi:hypothetical protein